MGEVRSPDSEFFEVAERILQNVNAVFERDDSLDEFDIVPNESQSNRSPVIHVNHKLALESWCVPFLYSHSFKCFSQILPKRNYCKHQHYHNGSSSIHLPSSSSSSSSSHRSWTYSSSDLTEADKFLRKLHLSRILVLLNPDLTVAWNFRREAYNRAFTKFQQELHLVSLVASRKPKCSECFSYRKWLVKSILKDGDVSLEAIYTIFEGEIQAAESAANKYFSNYHAWNYRLWLLETFLELSASDSEMRYKFLHAEKNSSDDWIETHVSDYSGYHYRQQLLQKLGKTEGYFSKTLKIFQNELDSNAKLISRYPGHEALWYHRRFIRRIIGDLSSDQ